MSWDPQVPLTITAYRFSTGRGGFVGVAGLGAEAALSWHGTDCADVEALEAATSTTFNLLRHLGFNVRRDEDYTFSTPLVGDEEVPQPTAVGCAAYGHEMVSFDDDTATCAQCGLVALRRKTTDA